MLTESENAEAKRLVLTPRPLSARHRPLSARNHPAQASRAQVQLPEPPSESACERGLHLQPTVPRPLSEVANEKAVCDLAAAGDSLAPVHRVPVVLERSQSVEPCEALDGENEQMRAPSVEIQTRVDLGAYSPQHLLEGEEIEEDDTDVHTYVAVPAQLQETLVSAEGDALNESGADDPAKASEQADSSSEQNTGIEKEKSQDLPCTQQTPQGWAAETDPASAVSVVSDRMTETPQVDVASSEIECSMEQTGISSASLVVKKRSMKLDGKDLKLDMDLILSTEPVEGQMTTPPDAVDEMVAAVEPSAEVYETESTTLQTLAEARDVKCGNKTGSAHKDR